MRISKPFEWDWETRETAQSVWFKKEDPLDDRGGLLIIRKDKRGRVSLYIASYGAGGFFERRFFSSDHGGAWGARSAALNWIKTQHGGSAE